MLDHTLHRSYQSLLPLLFTYGRQDQKSFCISTSLYTLEGRLSHTKAGLQARIQGCICCIISYQTYLKPVDPNEPVSFWVVSVNFSISLSVGAAII